MSVNKIVTKVDGTINKTIDFNDLKAGLAVGAHTITVEAYNGATLVSTQTKNITIAAVVAYDVDYQAVLDAVVAAGDTLPSTAQQDIDNQFMIDYKATGGWDKDDVVYKFKGVSSIGYKLMCWKRLVKAEAFGSLTWSDAGVKGNGTNSYIKTGYIPSAVNKFNLNDASVAFSSFELNTIGCIIGSFPENNNNVYVSPRTATSYFALNSTFFSTEVEYRVLGYTSYNRISPSFLTIDTTDISSNSGTVGADEIYILARNKLGVASIFSDAGLEFVSFGSSKKSIHNTIKAIF